MQLNILKVNYFDGRYKFYIADGYKKIKYDLFCEEKSLPVGDGFFNYETFVCFFFFFCRLGGRFTNRTQQGPETIKMSSMYSGGNYSKYVSDSKRKTTNGNTSSECDKQQRQLLSHNQNNFTVKHERAVSLKISRQSSIKTTLPGCGIQSNLQQDNYWRSQGLSSFSVDR